MIPLGNWIYSYDVDSIGLSYASTLFVIMAFQNSVQFSTVKDEDYYIQVIWKSKDNRL